ncbi:translation initiation factor IF-3, mitochondrial [Onthophagus taurus]|uniref:translation initiation factor IF-3, mitochondrial n=1 Tax=Onthophagus taurus TaxID=166361 RepID=UPI000C20A5B5|nr:uncharacterized protein LOC111415208 [Onthophagus taurus]XP_022902534.1 uncharacterized protein LOC111415208 [Onthophagus taurus]XP_022902535.1 uncharacterized protein LOC111415208 [Onthophagus taurus]XP_022902536.1 uncharacterized protein LOC111415208 [Onthophagus taurus]
MYRNLIRPARCASNQILPRLCPQLVQFAITTKAPELEIEGTTPQPKRKTAIIPKITLISQDQSVQITTLEEAQKLSKRRDLKLVKIIDYDTKSQRPIYKLMTPTEYLNEDLKQREKKKIDKANLSIKGDKVLILSSSIALHDLKIQIEKIIKWVKKSYEVRVIINGFSSNAEKVENIFKTLSEQVEGQCRIVQKRSKGNDMKFQVLPPKKEKDNENSS